MLVLDAEQSAERALEFAYQPDLLQIAVSCMLFTDRLSTNSANCIALLPAASSVLFTMLFWNPVAPQVPTLFGAASTAERAVQDTLSLDTP